MPKSSSERVRLHRLRELGYNLAPCPENTSKDECLAWAEGVWKRQDEQMTLVEGHLPNPK